MNIILNSFFVYQDADQFKVDSELKQMPIYN